MRTILRPTQVSDQWPAQASAAEKAVTGGAKVDRYSQVWRDTKPALQAASDDKCWYCEAREVRSDNAVDHFRPKSLYPWLAFKLDNFRYSCTFCNSLRRDPESGEVGGKGDHFPLLSGERASSDEGLALEDFVLIDPCRPDDVLLLDFISDGTCCPRFADGAKQEARARGSIEHYHLNHSKLVEERRVRSLSVDNFVDQIELVYEGAQAGDSISERLFELQLQQLMRLLHDSAEYSTFSRRALAKHRRLSWVESVLDAI